jgi:hypothetical protein
LDLKDFAAAAAERKSQRIYSYSRNYLTCRAINLSRASIYKSDFVLFYFLCIRSRILYYANFQLRLSGKFFDGAQAKIVIKSGNIGERRARGLKGQ